eukprot:3981465-Pyramimonas_sp.AAC.1
MEPVSFEEGEDRIFAPVGQDDMGVEGEREALEEEEEDSGTESMLEDIRRRRKVARVGRRGARRPQDTQAIRSTRSF